MKRIRAIPWWLGALLSGALAAVLLPAVLGQARDGGIAYHPAESEHGDAGVREFGQPLPTGARVVRIPIEGTIELGISAFIRRALEEHRDAQLVVLDINTLGGRVDAAIQIRDALLESPVKTVAFIHPRAISAGALIALATDVIVMTPGASIGAATPISGQGEAQSEAVEEKMTSYMRTEMRSTAEAKQRRGDVAEAMVDRSVELAGISQAGKVLTLDTDQALKLGIADRKARDFADLLVVMGLGEPVIVHAEESWAERAARFLTDPTVAGLLMSLGMLGLMVELYSPGLGLPGAVGVSCLLAFFMGHAVADLAGVEELALILTGVALLALEVFVIPGFGVAGILGLLMVGTGFVLALVGLPLGVSLSTGLLGEAVQRVSLVLLLTVALALLLMRFVPRSRAARRMVLASATDAQDGFVASPTDADLLGATGVALTDLRPAGKAELLDRRVDVVTAGEYIARGQTVVVSEAHGSRVVVQAAKA